MGLPHAAWPPRCTATAGPGYPLSAWVSAAGGCWCQRCSEQWGWWAQGTPGPVLLLASSLCLVGRVGQRLHGGGCWEQILLG